MCIAHSAPAIAIVGKPNVENIETGKGEGCRARYGQGQVASQALGVQKSYTPDKKHINQIEVSIARDTSIDKDVLAFLAKRREETTRSR